MSTDPGTAGDSELVRTVQRTHWKIAAIGLLPLAVWGGYQLVRMAQGYFAPHESLPPTEHLALISQHQTLPWGSELVCNTVVDTDLTPISHTPTTVQVGPGQYTQVHEGVYVPPGSKVFPLTQADAHTFDAAAKVNSPTDNHDGWARSLDWLVAKITSQPGAKMGCTQVPEVPVFYSK